MVLPRLVLAATKSGSGKTLITCALLQALLQRGENVRAFKGGLGPLLIAQLSYSDRKYARFTRPILYSVVTTKCFS